MSKSFNGKESSKVKSVPTKRAPDKWDSARFSSSFLASSFFCSQAKSTPTHLRVTQTVRQPSAKTKESLIRKFGFISKLEKENSLFGFGHFFSGGFGRLSFWFTLVLVLVFYFQA